MDTREKDIEKLKDYKYGFTTDIENIRAPKGLNEDVIKFISNISCDHCFWLISSLVIVNCFSFISYI